MNTDQINKWITLSANLGVLIGLFLLLAELNQNSDLLRAQIHQSRSDGWVAARLERGDTEFLLPAWNKYFEAGGPWEPTALDSLTPIERRRVIDHLQANFADNDNLYFQYQQGYLDEEFYQFRVVPYLRTFGPVWLESEWAQSTMRPSFEEEIRRVLSNQ